MDRWSQIYGKIWGCEIFPQPFVEKFVPFIESIRIAKRMYLYLQVKTQKNNQIYEDNIIA